MKRFWIAAFLSFCAIHAAIAQERNCQPQKPAKVPKVINRTYDQARRELIAADWKPVQTKSTSSDPDISGGNGPIFWERKYVEVKTCASTGGAPCVFLFKDANGNRLEVITAGEEIPEAKAHAVVMATRFVCDK
jgi:hypothetical protein